MKAVLLALLGALALAACGEQAPTSTTDTTETTQRTAERLSPPGQRELQITCPSGIPGCRTASGEILYVERVDPDGDGDAHFVLVSDESITGPGISVIDVRADLRPDPLPGPGDLLAAAGPVYEGSYGQRQIQAEVVETAREP